MLISLLRSKVGSKTAHFNGLEDLLLDKLPKNRTLSKETGNLLHLEYKHKHGFANSAKQKRIQKKINQDRVNTEEKIKKIKILHGESTLDLYGLFHPILEHPKKFQGKRHSNRDALDVALDSRALSKGFSLLSSLGRGRYIECEVIVYTSYDFHFALQGLNPTEIQALNKQVYSFWKKYAQPAFDQNGIKHFNSTESCSGVDAVASYEENCRLFYNDDKNKEFKECVDKIVAQFVKRYKELYNTDERIEYAINGLLREIAIFALAIKNHYYTCISHIGDSWAGNSMKFLVKSINILLEKYNIAPPVEFLNIQLKSKLSKQMPPEKNPIPEDNKKGILRKRESARKDELKFELIEDLTIRLSQLTEERKKIDKLIKKNKHEYAQLVKRYQTISEEIATIEGKQIVLIGTPSSRSKLSESTVSSPITLEGSTQHSFISKDTENNRVSAFPLSSRGPTFFSSATASTSTAMTTTMPTTAIPQKPFVTLK